MANLFNIYCIGLMIGLFRLMAMRSRLIWGKPNFQGTQSSFTAKPVYTGLINSITNIIRQMN